MNGFIEWTVFEFVFEAGWSEIDRKGKKVTQFMFVDVKYKYRSEEMDMLVSTV